MIPSLFSWLQRFHLPMKVSEATECVSLARSSGQYLELYQHYFPEELRQSIQLHAAHSVVPLPGNAYTLFEVQFLHLVNKHLFPIPEYVFDDMFEEHRYFDIPIEPFGMPSVYEYDIGEAADEMEVGWQLLLYLEGILQDGYFKDAFNADDPMHTVFAREIARGRMDMDVLKQHCEERQGPLSSFHLAYAVLNHDTGTTWLDALRDEEITDAGWEREVVDALVSQLAEAEEIWEQAMQFIRWLEEDLVQHFTEVIDIWNTCMGAAHVNQQRATPS